MKIIVLLILALTMTFPAFAEQPQIKILYDFPQIMQKVQSKNLALSEGNKKELEKSILEAYSKRAEVIKVEPLTKSSILTDKTLVLTLQINEVTSTYETYKNGWGTTFTVEIPSINFILVETFQGQSLASSFVYNEGSRLFFGRPIPNGDERTTIKNGLKYGLKHLNTLHAYYTDYEQALEDARFKLDFNKYKALELEGGVSID